MYPTHPLRPLLWRAFAANSAVLSAAALLLAVTPATVSSPIAFAEGLVLLGGLAALLGLNLALLQRAFGSARHILDAPVAAASVEARGHARVDREGGRRLLVCWTDPYHVSVDEAEDWASTELRRIMASEGIDAARLTRVRSASPRYGRPCDWLLELDVAPDGDAQPRLESPAWRAWLSDLGTLGAYPGAMVADHARVLTVEVE